MSLLTAIRRTAVGAAILGEWLGHGADPVPQEVSNARAAVCVTCPENRSPEWWNLHSNAIASWIRKCLAIKDDLGYMAALEDKLFMCRRCGCALPLKVHVPIKHIRDHSTDEQLREYPDFCWQRKELSL